MPILDNEILWRPAALVSDVTPTQNGGRMNFAQLVSGVKNNLFPDVSQSERLAGAVKWRKSFIHINSAQDTALLNVRLFLDALTPAGDFMTFCPGTQTDTEDQISGRLYGIATLKTDVPSGATQLEIAGEHPAAYAELQPFRVGDLVRIADRPSTGGAGNEEWVTLSGVSYAAESALLELAAPLAISALSVPMPYSLPLIWSSVSLCVPGQKVTKSPAGVRASRNRRTFNSAVSCALLMWMKALRHLTAPARRSDCETSGKRLFLTSDTSWAKRIRPPFWVGVTSETRAAGRQRISWSSMGMPVPFAEMIVVVFQRRGAEDTEGRREGKMTGEIMSFFSWFLFSLRRSAPSAPLR